MDHSGRRAMSLTGDPSITGSSASGSALSLGYDKASHDLSGGYKVIVVGAHPDDPETGCGGTMALFAQAGHRVVSAYLTRGEAGIAGSSHDQAAVIRTGEALEACRILHARASFLGQIDGACEATRQRYRDVYDFVAGEKPDILLSHWPIDTHRDHQVCSILVYDAWFRLGRRCPLFFFEVMTGRQTQVFSPTDYVDIGPVLERKHEACYVHKSQRIKASYDDDHGRMERFRGLESGCEYAEAFVRHVQGPGFPLLVR